MAAHKLPCATSKGCFLIPNSLFYSPISNFLFSIYQVFKEAISRYLREYGYDNIRLKAVLFDMDGVLFNSMPYHADAWHTVMERHGLHLSREEAYMHEGRTGAATINIVYQRQYGKDATPEIIESIYAEKSEERKVVEQILDIVERENYVYNKSSWMVGAKKKHCLNIDDAPGEQ